MKKLYRTRKNSILLGVCSGMAEEYGNHPWDVRIIFIVLTLLGGIGILTYPFAAMLMTEKPD